MKQTILMAIILVVVVVAIVAYFGLGTVFASQVVKAGDNISVFYTGSFTNGTVFNTNVGGSPFNFTAGANEVILGFDQAVIGMKLGQNKTVTIPVAEAYGPVNPALIVSVPLSELGNNTVKVGMIFTRTTTNGQRIDGFVTAINGTNATLNFNPQLAGKTLVFNIKVVAIQNSR